MTIDANSKPLVTQRLQMVFEEIQVGRRLGTASRTSTHGAKKEFDFAGLRSKFDDDDNLTYGAAW